MTSISQPVNQLEGRRTPFLKTRRARLLRENLTAYAFIAPAVILLFLFGVYPVLFAFFVSLHRWRRFPDTYEGLANYERALSGFANVPFFWLGVGALIFAAIWIVRVFQQGRLRGLIALVPGALCATALTAFGAWFFTVLPGVLNVPVTLRTRGVAATGETFINAFFEALSVPTVVQLGTLFIALLAVAVGVSVAYIRWTKHADAPVWVGRMFVACTIIVLGALALILVSEAMAAAIVEAGENTAELTTWAQIILISLGAVLLAGAYFLWTRTVHQFSSRRFLIGAVSVSMLAVAGVLLIMEVPRALHGADRDLLHSFVVTAMYSFGTVPFELAIGLGLAYLLFQKIRGRSLFRMVYFLPYITPFVATSIVFAVLFSHRESSPINNIVNFFGISDQKWLLEPVGIFRLMFGDGVPDVLAGPSLALVVIMIYTVWTYAGYHTVVFLAGLGNISNELYEAARIDGADSWSVFRYITLPLLSPTTFFLLLVSVIGTFQAFTQIWIMRTPAVSGAVDTVSVYIFEQARNNNPNLGYGSAMAFVLFGVILVLTLIQNRAAKKRVFYG